MKGSWIESKFLFSVLGRALIRLPSEARGNKEKEGLG